MLKSGVDLWGLVCERGFNMYVPQKQHQPLELPHLDREPGVKDPRAYDRQLMDKIESDAERKKRVRVADRDQVDAVVEQEVS